MDPIINPLIYFFKFNDKTAERKTDWKVVPVSGKILILQTIYFTIDNDSMPVRGKTSLQNHINPNKALNHESRE